jgi:hypothetical protein
MKMTTRSLVNSLAVASVATLAIAFGSAQAQAATLVDENFNAVATGLNLTGGVGSFTATAVATGGGVDVVGPSTFPLSYGGNGYGNYLDLNGDNAGQLESSNFTFNVGDVVNLSFDYGQNGGGSADVFLGSTLLTSLVAPGNASTFTPYTYSDTLTSSFNGSLRFVATGAGNGGIVLDNIKLTATNTSAVPEPSDFVGTAIAFGSVVLLRRNAIKKQNISK